MKIALHVQEEEGQLCCPAMLELKSLYSLHNSIGDTAVHTDIGTR